MSLDAPLRRRVLWVGAFPPPGSTIIGGFVTSCRLLRRSPFGAQSDLTLIDSTQPNNPAPPLAVRSLKAAARLLRFVGEFERTRPDAVLLFASSTQFSVAEKGLMGWYARLRGAAVLIFPRGGAVLDAGQRSPRVAAWLRRVFGGAHVVLCQGPAWHQFVTTTLGFSPVAAPIVPNWTATPELLELAEQRHNRAAPSPVRILFVGWVNHEKGTLELIEACRRLRDAAFDFHLTFVGDGVAADEVRALIASHDLGDRISMRGWLHGEELVQAYGDAEVFALPSWAEGLPNAMIEAMAAGLAVVVSAVGNVPALVTHGEQALLVPRRDAGALADALARVLSDQELRCRLGARASQWAAEQFGLDAAGHRMLAAVERAIELAAGPARRDPTLATRRRK